MTAAYSRLFVLFVCFFRYRLNDYSTQAKHLTFILRIIRFYILNYTHFRSWFYVWILFLFDSIQLNCRQYYHTRCPNYRISKNRRTPFACRSFSIFFIYNQKNNNKFLFWFIGSPGILNSPPPSPSCSHPNANGDVFFPRGNSSNNGSASSSSSVQPSTPSSIRMHDDYRSAQWSPRSSVSVPRRR